MLKIYGLIILGSLFAIYWPMNAIIDSNISIDMKIITSLCTVFYLLEGVSDMVLRFFGYKD